MEARQHRMNNDSPDILARQLRAVALRTAGLETAAIAHELDCSRHTVATLLRRADDTRVVLVNADWLEGLPYRSVRTLMQLGYTSKAEVIAALATGQLSVNTPNVGRAMLATLCAWLGVPVPTKPAVVLKVAKPKMPTAVAIARAQRTLERAGWTVTPPGSAD